jgi:membrane protein YqaA with SNARE-associated domain
VFGDCEEPKPDSISFWTIVWAVQLESFLWGIGTAMGELPPYFIARAARAQGKKSEELDEIEAEQSHWLIQKGKSFVSTAIVKNGFCTVLICASIPNPLFDLAGLLCGHFGISFWTFFGAAVIGKAFIKVHIQMIFTVFLFAKHHVESLLKFIESALPFMKGTLS